jgi:hypothetical protein
MHVSAGVAYHCAAPISADRQCNRPFDLCGAELNSSASSGRLLLNIRGVENGALCYAFRDFPVQVVNRVKERYDDLDWLFGIEHDGFRALAIRPGGPTRLIYAQRMTSKRTTRSAPSGALRRQTRSAPHNRRHKSRAGAETRDYVGFPLAALRFAKRTATGLLLAVRKSKRPRGTLSPEPIHSDLDRAVGYLDWRGQWISVAIPKTLPSERVEFRGDLRARTFTGQFDNAPATDLNRGKASVCGRVLCSLEYPESQSL